MYWRRIALILLFCKNLLANTNIDELLLDAVFYEFKNFEKSSTSYLKLYEQTKSCEFVKLALKQSLSANLVNQDYLIEELKKCDPNDLMLLKAQIVKAMNQKEHKKVFELSNEYLDKEEDYNLALGVYLYALNDTKDKKKALDFTKKYYKKYKNYNFKMLYLDALMINNDFKTILKLTKDTKLQEEDYEFLEIRKIALKESKKYKEIPNLALYLYSLNNDYSNVLISIEALVLDNKIDDAINIAKEYEYDKIFDLYIKKQDYKNASKTLYLYAINNNDFNALTWSYIYELLDTKGEGFDYFKLDEIIAKGEVDASILNTYAYILINEQIDNAKGIELVRKALAKEPNNPYFLDTLAWGMYYEKRCNEAFNILNIALEDKEFAKLKEAKEHKKAIKKCKK